MSKELVLRDGNVAGTPAAQYIRMSTEHQRYSPDNQKAAIASFAADRGFEVVKTYLDAGKSGLTLAKRDGLTRHALQCSVGSSGAFSRFTDKLGTARKEGGAHKAEGCPRHASKSSPNYVAFTIGSGI